jgi:nucleoside 2-deoxyribosyltransferase
MLVHFSGSQWDIVEQIDDFRKIIKAIHNQGHSVTRDWVEPTYEIAKKDKDYAQQDWHAIYQENLEAIARADIAIFEVTTQSFAVGYMVAAALQQKKPILMLARGEESMDGTFISGMDKSIVTVKIYDDDSLEDIVSQFLEQNHIENKDLRFNFFIDRQIYNYLRWASFKTGKTKAEILRELVLHDIERQDYRP